MWLRLFRFGVVLATLLACPSSGPAQPGAPGGPDRLRSFSVESDPSTLERVRDGLEPGSSDWVEATRRLADHKARDCYDSGGSDAPTCREAAALYQQALDAGTPISRLDELLFDYGLLLSWNGDESAGATLWQRLLSELPDSGLRAHAALALGEHYFTNAMLAPAREALQQALAYPEFTGRYYALYLDAWCALNQTDTTEALELMTEAFRVAVRDRPDDLEIRAQILHDLTMMYAMAGEPAEAFAFFSALAPAEAAELVERTAQALREMGRDDDAEEAKDSIRR